MDTQRDKDVDVSRRVRNLTDAERMPVTPTGSLYLR
jgi:hypothetical protein